MTLENQERLEEARQKELLLKEQADQQAAAEAEAQAQAAIAQAAVEKAAVVQTVAGWDHSQKQALVDQVMGLSDRAVLPSVQQELGLNVQPAGQDRYEIVTAEGAQPVPMLSLRKLLADKLVANYDAEQVAKAEAEKQHLADVAAAQKRTDEAKIKKETEVAAWALANTREELRMGRTLSPQQLALLEAVRDQLTPQEVARLDAGPAVAQATQNGPSKSLQMLGARGKMLAEEDPALPNAAQDKAVPDAQVIEELLRIMASQLDNTSTGGLIANEDGEKKWMAQGGWISETAGIFRKQLRRTKPPTRWGRHSAKRRPPRVWRGDGEEASGACRHPDPGQQGRRQSRKKQQGQGREKGGEAACGNERSPCRRDPIAI
ncbi:MAG: hypothetical protein WCK00_04140 [Deltaproteobacteria bacterium]